MNKLDLASNNQQWLICHKTKSNNNSKHDIGKLELK